ncbi:hypothetical protein [Spiroplasma endosymbiont of Aspidapion aeneum]|uniref:hypothetical protein n=1 Tax=Spiroplasma endosymbiont of Aspidapion aeneum TaxID=3066276 RepID=UPI00313CB9F7
MRIRRNTEFSIKLAIIIVLIGFLIYDLFLQLGPHYQYLRGLPYDQRMDIYFAYFTTQSNYITVFYLMFSLIYSRINRKRTPFTLDLAVTTYICITMVVFWTTLLPSSKVSGGLFQGWTISTWIVTMVLHLFIPLVMIVTFVSSAGDNYHSITKHNKFSLFAIATYPALYLVFQLVRGAIRIKIYGPAYIEQNFWYVKDPHSNKLIPQSNWYHLNSKGEIESIGGATMAQLYSYTIYASYFFLNIYKFDYFIKVKEFDDKYHEYIWKGKYYNGTNTPTHEPYKFEFNKFSDSSIIIYFIFSCLFISFCVFAIQYLLIFNNNMKYFKFFSPSGREYSKKEIAIIKWKRQESIVYSRIYFVWIAKSFKYFKTNVLLKRRYKKLDRQQLKNLISDRIKALKKLIKFRKIEYKKLKTVIKEEKKFIKQTLPEVKYLDRQEFKDNVYESWRFQKMRLFSIIITITNEDIITYEKISEIENKYKLKYSKKL